MTQPIESFVTVPQIPTGVGPAIRNFVLTIPQPNGTSVAVQIQATSIVDGATGRVLDVEGPEWRDEVVQLLRAIAKGIGIMCDEDIQDQPDQD
jgi:hypothetical protein